MRKGEKILVARHSPFSHIVLTEDQAGLRILRFGPDGPRQSVVKLGDPDYLEIPYASVLPACLAFIDNPQRILVVGLGGGTIPNLLHAHLPDATIDVVEIDPDVLDIAKQYCGFSEDHRLHVYIEDGRDFIESHTSHYDIVILDSFDAESIPPHLTTLEFLEAVHRALSPVGIAVANVWNREHNRLYDSMVLTYREAFEDMYIFDIPFPGSKLFIGLKHRETILREEILIRASELSVLYKFRYDISSAIHGFRNASEERLRRGTVLTDASPSGSC
jgi:spermidine synthase